MKKMILIGILVISILTVGCGKAPEEKIIGTWEVYEIDKQSLREAFDVAEDEQMYWNLTFFENGRVESVMPYGGGSEQTVDTGSYTLAKGKINFSEEFTIDGTHEFQIKGNKMTIEVDGWEDFTSIKLKKAD